MTYLEWIVKVDIQLFLIYKWINSSQASSSALNVNLLYSFCKVIESIEGQSKVFLLICFENARVDLSQHASNSSFKDGS